MTGLNLQLHASTRHRENPAQRLLATIACQSSFRRLGCGTLILPKASLASFPILQVHSTIVFRTLDTAAIPFSNPNHGRICHTHICLAGFSLDATQAPFSPCADERATPLSTLLRLCTLNLRPWSRVQNCTAVGSKRRLSEPLRGCPTREGTAG